ncbi:MAG: 50S ribosomal protein L24 [Methylacidiphilales bacterium]|nr:50S ribosomal protein L24 [Candidatus Methylacidiphilales bacterium]
MKHLKKGDEVKVLSGKDKGRVGKILKIINPSHCIVSGIQVQKNSIKANPNQNQQGGFENKEMPIPLCKVSKYNSKNKKSERTFVLVQENGKKIIEFVSNRSK